MAEEYGEMMCGFLTQWEEEEEEEER